MMKIVLKNLIFDPTFDPDVKIDPKFDPTIFLFCLIFYEYYPKSMFIMVCFKTFINILYTLVFRQVISK